MKNLHDLHRLPNVRGDLHAETTTAKRKVDEDSNFLAVAGSTKDSPDLFSPVKNVLTDLLFETTEAKGKVDEDPNFPATAGSPKLTEDKVGELYNSKFRGYVERDVFKEFTDDEMKDTVTVLKKNVHRYVPNLVVHQEVTKG